MLTADQRRRYARNISLPEIGIDGQCRLLNGKVLVIGCGALGSIVAMYLAGSGVGHLTIVDYDTIDVSNLQRQLSFTTASCGEKKVLSLKQRLQEINPGIEVNALDKVLTRSNIDELISAHDIIVECSDNASTKHLVASAANRFSKPCVIGGVREWEGQITTCMPGCKNYLDLFEEAAEDSSMLPCGLGGVLGPLPGIVGSVQATEVIKLLVGCGEVLSSRMHLIDALTAKVQTITF